RKLSRPRKNADLEPVIVTISQACAIFCIHVPMLDAKAPIQRRRKSRWVRAIAIRPEADRRISSSSTNHPWPKARRACKASLIFARLRSEHVGRFQLERPGLDWAGGTVGSDDDALGSAPRCDQSEAARRNAALEQPLAPAKHQWENPDAIFIDEIGCDQRL